MPQTELGDRLSSWTGLYTVASREIEASVSELRTVLTPMQQDADGDGQIRMFRDL